jgi:hypothetical protein
VIIQAPAAPLRTDMFKTMRRETTDRILVRYTRNEPDPRIDSAYLDGVATGRRYLGIPFHYLILLDGKIEIGRDPNTISTYSRRLNRSLQVVIGVVGGLDAEGAQLATMSADQSEALEELLQGLADAYGVPLEITDDTVLSEEEPNASNFENASSVYLIKLTAQQNWRPCDGPSRHPGVVPQIRHGY